MLNLKKYLPLLLGLFILLQVSCKKDKADPIPAADPKPALPAYSLTKVSGDNQTGLENQPLVTPLKVRLLKQNGTPEANRSIEFTVTSGKGTLNASNVITDQNGEAQVIWTLGPTVPGQAVKASLLDSNNQPVTSVSTSFTARLGVYTLNKISGDNQTGYINQALLLPVKVQLFNPDGSFGANKSIRFEVTRGNGILNAAKVLTDQFGYADVMWTLGPSDTIQTLKAYLEDASNQPVASTIVTISPKVKLVFTVAGGNGKGSNSNQFDDAWGIFVDAGGNVFVADRFNNRIQKWTPGTASGITVAGGNGQGYGANQFFNPHKPFVDGSGNLYVADINNQRVQKWLPGATGGITVAGGNGAGSASNQLYAASSVFVDANGNIYVTELLNARVSKWAPGATNGVTVAGGNGYGSGGNQLDQPHGVWVDAAGNVFVVDHNNSRIQKWAPGALTGITVAGGNGAGNAANQLNYPTGIYLDGNGNIFIADTRNHRIQKWVPGASAGLTVAGGNGLGNATNQLHFPTDVFVDKQQNLYISDNANYRIQKWIP